jgi:hypothetical protein
MLVLSKKIPSYIKQVMARWCKKEFMEMSPEFRRIRGEKDNMLNCYWCKHKFEDGEMMALASFVGKVGNGTLCQKCASELLGENLKTPANVRGIYRRKSWNQRQQF